MTEDGSTFIQQILEERNRLFQENANLKSQLIHQRQEDENAAILHHSALQVQLDYHEQLAREAIMALSGKESIIEVQAKTLHAQNKTIGDQQEQILYLKQ